jgi:hypothetical protein
MMLQRSLILGVVLGQLADATSLRIVVDEYRKHPLAGWHLWKGALWAGAFALVASMLWSLAAGTRLKQRLGC